MTTSSSFPAKSSILRLPQVSKRTGLSASSIYNKLKQNSRWHDPTFPQQVRLGANAVGWLESEVDAWITSRTANQEAPSASPQGTRIASSDNSTASVQGEPAKSRDEDYLHEKRVQTLEVLLDKRAKTGSRILCKLAMKHLMLNPDLPEERAEMDRIVETISKRSHAGRRGLLGVLVHDSNGPSQRFFELARTLGYKFESTSKFTDDHLKFQFEIREVEAERSKGKLQWFEFKGKPILMRRK